jgi:hypothetical protein
MTTRNEDSLIKKKIFVTNEDLDSQMNLDESEDEESIDR